MSALALSKTRLQQFLAASQKRPCPAMVLESNCAAALLGASAWEAAAFYAAMPTSAKEIAERCGEDAVHDGRRAARLVADLVALKVLALCSRLGCRPSVRDYSAVLRKAVKLTGLALTADKKSQLAQAMALQLRRACQ